MRFWREKTGSIRNEEKPVVIEGEYKVIAVGHERCGSDKKNRASDEHRYTDTRTISEKRYTRDRRKLRLSFFPLETRVTDRRKHQHIHIEV
jgi:hypothetical protein